MQEQERRWGRIGVGHTFAAGQQVEHIVGESLVVAVRGTLSPRTAGTEVAVVDVGSEMVKA